MGVYNQIALIIPYYTSSTLVTLLEVIDPPKQVPNILDLTVIFKFLNFGFQILLHFFREMSVSFTS